MARKYIFADESGNFDFTRKQGASKYFILTTIASASCAVGDELLALRRELAWEGHGLNTEFHATEDTLLIRDRVFEVLEGANFRIDATILEKAKAQPIIRPTDERFYKYAWFFHLKHVAPKVASANDDLMVVSASLGTKKKRQVMYDAVQDVVRQVDPTVSARTASWAAHSDPCLQVADYCCWAVRRKWEMGDTSAYDRISTKISSEFDVFSRGTRLYY